MSLFINGAEVFIDIAVGGTWTAHTPLTMPAFAGAGNISLLADNRKIIFGTGSDNEIYHDGANFVLEAGNGYVILATTGSLKGLIIKSTQDAVTGAQLTFHHISASPAVGDALGTVEGQGRDDGNNWTQYVQIKLQIENPADGSEAGKIGWFNRIGAAWNEAMTLSSIGRLWVDADIDFSTSVDSAAVANHVSLGCYEIAAGERSLAISQENPVVTEAIGASDRTLPVRINGATYKILLKAV